MLRTKINNNVQTTHKCEGCGTPSHNRFCERCSKDRKKTGGLPQNCAICHVSDQCRNLPKNRVSKCKKCNHIDRCNMVRGGLCLDCYFEEYGEKNKFVFNIPTVDDKIEAGWNE